MDIRKIKKLIDLMIESDLQAIEVKEGDQSIALTRRNPVVAAAVPAMPAQASGRCRRRTPAVDCGRGRRGLYRQYRDGQGRRSL